MNKRFLNVVISGALAAAVLYGVFKVFKTSPNALAETIQNKIRGALS